MVKFRQRQRKKWNVLNLANPPLVPPLTPNASTDNEQIVRVVRALDCVQFRIVRAEERVLKVRLENVGFI